MKDIDRNLSPNKKTESSSDILLYALLFILVALLVGGAVWYFWPPEEKQWDHNFEKALGEKLTAPTEKDVSQLISGNRSRRKSAKRVLEDKIKGRKLSDKEKKAVKAELKNDSEDFDETVQSWNLKDLEKKNPDMLKGIYDRFYEEGKVTVRLRDKTAVGRSTEELKAQEKFQKEWDISEPEGEEITKKMNGWITTWYNQAKDELIPGQYPSLTEYIEVKWDKGVEVKNPTRSQINKFKTLHKFYDKNEVKTDEIDLSKDLDIKFDGYYGFLTDEDKKGSSEGKETFGLTKYPSGLSRVMNRSEGVVFDEETHDPIGPVPQDFFLINCFAHNLLKMEIGLEKKLFFNRLGYEEWLTEVTDKGSWTHFDICFEEVVETIAHELAHAITSTIKGNYEGEEGGGHGKFFYDMLKKIEEMIKNSPEFLEFKTWWELPEKEHARFVSEKSHWDEWKYWYIGGGALIMISAIGLVAVFWPESASSKRHAKN